MWLAGGSEKGAGCSLGHQEDPGGIHWTGRRGRALPREGRREEGRRECQSHAGKGHGAGEGHLAGGAGLPDGKRCGSIVKGTDVWKS